MTKREVYERFVTPMTLDWADKVMDIKMVRILLIVFDSTVCLFLYFLNDEVYRNLFVMLQVSE